MNNYLAHYGRKGMKWYQHIFGENDPRAKYGRKNLKKASSARFDQWGKSPDTNVLYVAGYSGSGKSTVADYLSNDGAEVIHLDQYSDADNHGNRNQSKSFNRYLDKELPNWRKLYTDNSFKFSKEYWDLVDQFGDSIEAYGRKEFKNGNKVVVEGVQIADNWLHMSQTFYGNKPIIVLDTNKAKSMLQAYNRDDKNLSISAIKNLFSASGNQWSGAMDTKINSLKENAGAKQGDKAIGDFIKKYGARKI